MSGQSLTYFYIPSRKTIHRIVFLGRVQIRLQYFEKYYIIVQKDFPFSDTKLGEKDMYEDEKLVCEDCGVEFIFTVGEQEFYAEKGLVNKPKRCPDCRKKRRQNNRRNRAVPICDYGRKLDRSTFA